ncbi:hypothetical protein TVAGG3_0200230, partial [Trichomonas vaginalis G3]|uniref:hypothetical protein n=1 Tax=Trichomonas vaginalis (strain ATCC PRA-98 / G3) TaxID=412133 RepID=UPI0021E57D63
MFAFLIFSSAQKTYQGWQSQPIQEAAQESYNIIECQFVGIGGDSSSSALWLHGGTTSTSIYLLATLFHSCKAGQGGAFSFTDNADLRFFLCCVSNCQTGGNSYRKGAIGYVVLKSNVPRFEYFTANSNSVGSRNLHVESSPNFVNCNFSNNIADNGKESYSYGNIYIYNNGVQTTYGYYFTNFYRNQSPCSTIYHDYCQTLYINSCNFLENTVTDYAMIYFWYSWYAYIKKCVIKGNTLGSTYIADNKRYSQGCEFSDCYCDNKKFGSGCTTKNWDEELDQNYIYTYYATANCQAVRPYPRRSNTFAPTPYQTAFQTPFLTAAKTPFSTPFGTAFMTPFRTMSSTPFNTEIATPFYTESVTPFNTFYMTPFSTAHETPVVTPFNTHQTTPFETQFSTPNDTPFNSMFETPFDTCSSTPYETAFETPFQSAFETAYETPFQSAFETAYETPFQSMFETAYETPIITEAETAFESPFETVFETASQTALETVYETPFETAFETAYETPVQTETVY